MQTVCTKRPLERCNRARTRWNRIMVTDAEQTIDISEERPSKKNTHYRVMQ